MIKNNSSQLSATTLSKKIARREISPVEAVDTAFARIGEVQDPLNPFCFLYEDEAREKAHEAEQVLARGFATGPLHGVPIAIKDFTPLAGKPTTRGSYALESWVPDEDPVIVRRLKKAGAIIVGKTTTPEFAFSSFTESPLWGITRNPWDRSRTSGGSSGGSAVAVATGCVPLAEGTDMGGSIRIPAALCGVVGLKPSLGRIPMDILPTVFDSISHFGPLARTIDDIILFLSITQGPSDSDIQSQISTPSLTGIGQDSMRGKKIALSMDLGFFKLDPDVEKNTLNAASLLRELGSVVEEVELGWSRVIIDTWVAYWGVFLSASFGHLRDENSERMDPAVLRLMADGDKMDAVSFKKIEFVWTNQWKKLASIFEDYDALICPTMAVPAPPVGMDDSDFDFHDENGKLHGLDMTSPFNNVPQCPALSVPSGFTENGLPTGLQVVGKRFDDRGVLEIGAALESVINWPQWLPHNEF
jgi:Asp-tRNA(Asn)/Glu-tRNA(Gln) amidotransferase A subunit family amidase